MASKDAEIDPRLEPFIQPLRDTSHVIASYYYALVSDGLPEGLCRQLVEDYHALYWQMVLMPVQAGLRQTVRQTAEPQAWGVFSPKSAGNG